LVALYVVSTKKAAGKTAVCVGLARKLREDGYKIGYLKLFAGEEQEENARRDATFMKRVLNLSESSETLCALSGKLDADADAVKESCEAVSSGMDVVIVEGVFGAGSEDSLSMVSYRLAETLKAKVVIVEGYPEEDITGSICEDFGKNLLGAVINKVPQSRLDRVCEETNARFSGSGINILGILPEDRVLFTITVGELAGCIQGEIINNNEKSAELVENVMVGAMCVDSGLDYFGRKSNKAAVVRDDRPDMQMAALGTSLQCLVISGKTPPVHAVRYLSESKNVPIIMAGNDIVTVIGRLEDALGSARFNQDKKLPKIGEITEKFVDYEAVTRGLGLSA